MIRPLSLSLLVVISLLSASACQTEECSNYVLCQQAFDAEFNNIPFDTSRFEKGGDCWDQKSTSESCTEACIQQQENLRLVAADADVVLDECR